MNVHFIAIGGSVMHNLALSLRAKGYNVTGSDDEIFEPALSLLKVNGLLPDNIGWDPERIHAGLDAIILGMHARAHNPELLRAQELGLKIYSFPAFVAQQTRNKMRVVIGGSHGKTTITSMIMHVLKYCNYKFDYLVGSRIQGFDLMVNLTEDAPIVVIEGDEYLSSPIERIPKFHLYEPHIGLISGIAWDHINVFPTFENYTEQFSKFVDTFIPGGILIYNEEDTLLQQIAKKAKADIIKQPYHTPSFTITDGKTSVNFNGKSIPLEIFGKHNLQNMEGARLVCESLGMSSGQFFEAVSTFTGAAKRLELVARGENSILYKDFAHSPSKLKATIQAVKEQFPQRKLTGVMELHTFSSLNKNFLTEYRDSMNDADCAVVYFNRHTLEMKKLPPLTEQDIRETFNNDKLLVFTETNELLDFLNARNWHNSSLLMMSSGSFDGLDWKVLGEKVTAN